MKRGFDGNRLTQKNAYAGGDGKRFVVHAEEKLMAFLELEKVTLSRKIFGTFALQFP